MSEIADSMDSERLTGTDEGAIEPRIFRVMIVTVTLAVVAGTVLAPWRVTAGLALGGALSLLNYHWLRTSIAAIFSIDMTLRRPRARTWRYLIRYFVVGLAVFVAYQLHLVSLPATFAGLCSFVPALFVEAVRQFYFAIILGKESY
jgi:hypothetical protein